MSDYRRTRNDCFRDNFYGTMMALSHQHGLKWHAESGGPWVRTPEVFGEADQLAFLARTDMPQGEFWYMASADRRGRQMSRPQAITAHIYGKRLAAAEAFTHMAAALVAVSRRAETRGRREFHRRSQPARVAHLHLLAEGVRRAGQRVFRGHAHQPQSHVVRAGRAVHDVSRPLPTPAAAGTLRGGRVRVRG